MEAYGGVQVQLHILDLVTTLSSVVNFMSRPLYHRVPFEKEDGWAPELVCAIRKREKHVASPRN
jgi:hypothetical protein